MMSDGVFWRPCAATNGEYPRFVGLKLAILDRPSSRNPVSGSKDQKCCTWGGLERTVDASDGSFLRRWVDLGISFRCLGESRIQNLLTQHKTVYFRHYITLDTFNI